jgi:hypothetical protein
VAADNGVYHYSTILPHEGQSSGKEIHEFSIAPLNCIYWIDQSDRF